MKLHQVKGTYGSNKFPCTIFVLTEHTGYSWYVVEGSQNVNYTADTITEGVDIEGLEDLDYFQASKPIESVEELETAINE
jgi:hypothetical protein